MRVAEYPLEQLHWIIRKDPWVRAIFLASGVKLDAMAERILDLATFEDSETMMARSLELWERILGINPEAGASMVTRRQAVRAMWLASLPPSIETIQAVCDNWRGGEIEASYEAGVGIIVLTYLASFGPQKGQAGLVRTLNTVKPAHLALEHAYRYYKIKELHRQMSVEEMARIPLSHFAGGTGRTDRHRGLGVRAVGACLWVLPQAAVTVQEQGDALILRSGGQYTPLEEQAIGDGLLEVENVLTVAWRTEVSARETGETLVIGDKEE